MTSAGDEMPDHGKLTPVLTRRWLSPRSWTLDTYHQFEGYRALRKALSAEPEQLVQLIKDSGLRGRGGAGLDRKSTRLNSSHANISYAVFCLKKKKTTKCFYFSSLLIFH